MTNEQTKPEEDQERAVPSTAHEVSPLNPSYDVTEKPREDRESTVSERVFRSPKGRIYRIIRTNEVDDYEQPLKPEQQNSQP